MSPYKYINHLKMKAWPYPDDLTWWEKACLWGLMRLYGARYWREVALSQCRMLSAQKKQDQKKAQRIMNMYLHHVYGAQDVVFNEVDEAGVAETAVSGVFEMSDEDFLRTGVVSP